MSKSEYQKARENFVVMLVCTALSLALLLYVIPVLIKVPDAATRDDAFTPRTFPYFLGVIMALCSLIGDIKYGIGFFKVRREAQTAGILTLKAERKTPHEITTSMMPWIVYGLIVLYGWGINKIGFILPTAIMIPTILLLLRCRKWQYYLYIYLFTILIWMAFRFALHVQLP